MQEDIYKNKKQTKNKTNKQNKTNTTKQNKIKQQIVPNPR